MRGDDGNHCGDRAFHGRAWSDPGGNRLVQFIGHKGSGLFEFNFLTNASGGSLSADGITAGAFEGVDAIEIVDIGAGTVETAGVVVLEDASIQVELAADVLLQKAVSVSVNGGSGFLKLTQGDELCMYEDGLLRCDSSGQHALVCEDIYSGAQVSTDVNVAHSLPWSSIRAGEFLDDHTTQTVGDLNGDGFPDAILGSAPASVTATNGGGVYIFRGQADGWVGANAGHRSSPAGCEVWPKYCHRRLPW